MQTPLDQTSDANGIRSVELDESTEARIERLGRERPPCFSSIWSESAFCFSVLMSQILTEYFMTGSNVILPELKAAFDIPEASMVWPTSALSLVVASTLMVFGRLSDIVGGYVIYICGGLWLTIWSLIAGFSQNMLMLVFCRALQGLGLAAMLPSGVMLLAITYRPGPRKNLVFGLYGACAVLGFFAGIFFSGLAGQYLSWHWYFFFGTIFAAVTTVSTFLSVPSDYAEHCKQHHEMDWAGACLTVAGLVLFVFAITESSHAPQRWRTPYVYICLIAGAIILAAAVYVEGWVAKAPILPADVFRVPYMKPVVIALSLVYGGLGIYLLYGVLYMTTFMGASPLQIVAWSTPMVVGGVLLSSVGGAVLHLIPGTILLIFSGAGFIGTGLLFALIPEGGVYWAWVFPAMICATIGIDITFNVANVFITTSVPSAQKGIAGGLVNSVQHLGVAVLLGFADITQAETAHLGLRQSYKAVFWFEAGTAGFACAVMALFIRIGRAKSDLTVDEKRELAQGGSWPAE